MTDKKQASVMGEVPGDESKVGSKVDDRLSMSISALRKLAIDAGFPEDAAKGLQTKVSAVAVIDSLRPNKDATDTKKVASIDEPTNPREEKLIAKQFMAKRDIMRAKLEKQAQVPIFIPKTDTEKPGVVKIVKVRGQNEYVHISGAVEPFTLNGYMVIVPKGVQTMVPMQVFKMWSESMQLTQQAGQDFMINRIDPETGQPVSNRL